MFDTITESLFLAFFIFGAFVTMFFICWLLHEDWR